MQDNLGCDMGPDDPYYAMHSAQFWRDRAADARAKADNMRDAHARDTMMQVAALYERMADRTERKDRPQN